MDVSTTLAMLAPAATLDAGDAVAEDIDTAIKALESEMSDLQLRSRDVFVLANAWAERHDAILAMTPPELRESTEAQLRRIGIRWGVAEGARMTGQFPALKP